DVANRMSRRRRASRSNLPRSAALYPSHNMRKSTLSAGSPLFRNSINAPGAAGRELPNVQVFACGAVLEDLAVGIRIILEEGNYSRAWRHSVGSVRTTTIDGAAGAKPRRFASR